MTSNRRRAGAVLTALVLGTSMALPGALAAFGAEPTPFGSPTATTVPSTAVEMPAPQETVPAPAGATEPEPAVPADPQVEVMAEPAQEPQPATPSPAPSEGAAAIAAKYETVRSQLGAPTSEVICGGVRGGCYQLFGPDSAIVWSPATGAHVSTGAIREKWGATGYERGSLGYPVTDEVCGLVRGGCFQMFEFGAAIVWSPDTGAHVSTGAIREKWGATDFERGLLGYPTSDERCGLVGGGCLQNYENGTIYWSPNTGTHYVKGSILGKWGSTGWEAGLLGYPVGDERCGLVGGGCLSNFEHGTIYWSPTTDAHYVKGAILGKWGSAGWEAGFLGYPTSDERCGLVRGGCLNNFQGGAVYWSPDSGTHWVKGAILGKWGSTGWEGGRYGYPVSDEECRTGAGGTLCTSEFENGKIKWRSDVGVIDCAVQRCVALTFDDGPSQHTSRLLDILDSQNVQATFFAMGSNIERYPATAQRAHANGNEVMNHTWDHPRLTEVDSSEIASQLNRTSNTIEATVGERPTLMRPPHGAYNQTVVSVSGQEGMAVVVWNIETSDWYHLDTATTIRNATNGAKPGGIVLMHDLYPETVEAVPDIIRNMKNNGYTLVTASDVIGDPRPGVVYDSRP